MGLFDYVGTKDPRFACSEGHDLNDEEFQSKDFGCTMGSVNVVDNCIHMENGGYGDSPARPLLGRFVVYCTCTKCPAFVQFGTGNEVGCSVEFVIDVVDDVIRSITRTSQSTTDFVRDEPLKRHMKRCEGPMSYAEATQLHIHYREMRPADRAEFDAWAHARSVALKAGKPWSWELPVGDYPEEFAEIRTLREAYDF